MWSRNQNSQVSRQGFTLLELIVTTTLGLLFVGGSLAAFNNFSARQSKIESARNVQGVLQEARERSRDGNKPEDCGTLNYYRVWGARLSNNYYVAIRCDGSAQNKEFRSYSLASGEYFRQNFEVFFPPLPGPIPGAPATISIGKSTDAAYYQFTIESNGVISEGEVLTN